MNLFDLLQYVALVKGFVDAVKKTPKGEPVSVPPIKGIRIGGRSYTIRNAEAVPEA